MSGASGPNVSDDHWFAFRSTAGSLIQNDAQILSPFRQLHSENAAAREHRFDHIELHSECQWSLSVSNPVVRLFGRPRRRVPVIYADDAIANLQYSTSASKSASYTAVIQRG